MTTGNALTKYMTFGREMYGTDAGSKDGLNSPPLFCPNPANWTPWFTYSFVMIGKGNCLTWVRD